MKIKRLFIVENFGNEELNDKLRGFLREQRATRIEAGVVAWSEVPPRDRGDRIPEFVIFDGQLVFEMTTDRGQSYPNAKLDVREANVDRRKVRFEALWNARLEEPPREPRP